MQAAEDEKAKNDKIAEGIMLRRDQAVGLLGNEGTQRISEQQAHSSAKTQAKIELAKWKE